MLATKRVDALTVALMAAKRAKKIGARMRERRDELHLTQTEVATRIGVASVNKDYLSRWELGKTEPSEAYLDQIAGALETTVADLMAGPVSEREEPGPTPDILGSGLESDGKAVSVFLARLEVKVDALLAHHKISVDEDGLPLPPEALRPARATRGRTGQGQGRQKTGRAS